MSRGRLEVSETPLRTPGVSERAAGAGVGRGASAHGPASAVRAGAGFDALRDFRESPEPSSAGRGVSASPSSLTGAEGAEWEEGTEVQTSAAPGQASTSKPRGASPSKLGRSLLQESSAEFDPRLGDRCQRLGVLGGGSTESTAACATPPLSSVVAAGRWRTGLVRAAGPRRARALSGMCRRRAAKVAVKRGAKQEAKPVARQVVKQGAKPVARRVVKQGAKRARTVLPNFRGIPTCEVAPTRVPSRPRCARAASLIQTMAHPPLQCARAASPTHRTASRTPRRSLPTLSRRSARRGARSGRRRWRGGSRRCRGSWRQSKGPRGTRGRRR